MTDTAAIPDAADALVGPAPAPPPLRADGPKHAVLHAECLNCGAMLHGRYCSTCGQPADDHHRSILHLAWEAVEGMTHLDGRLGQTLPMLLFRPGRLARDQLDGRRARHVPPFRLFLVALLLFMLSLEAGLHGGAPSRASLTLDAPNGAHVKVVTATPAELAKVASGELTPEQLALQGGSGAPLARPRGPLQPARPTTTLEAWIRDHVGRAAANPEYFKLVVFTWAHRLAVLLLPIFAAQLALLYAWRRHFYIYDHLVVSMQFLAFVFLVSAVAWLPPQPWRGVLILVAVVWTPVNLYQLLRGAYGSSRVAAALRTLVLWLGAQAVFGALVVGLLVLGLQQL